MNFQQHQQQQQYYRPPQVLPEHCYPPYYYYNQQHQQQQQAPPLQQIISSEIDVPLQPPPSSPQVYHHHHHQQQQFHGFTQYPTLGLGDSFYTQPAPPLPLIPNVYVAQNDTSGIYVLPREYCSQQQQQQNQYQEEPLPIQTNRAFSSVDAYIDYCKEYAPLLQQKQQQFEGLQREFKVTANFEDASPSVSASSPSPTSSYRENLLVKENDVNVDDDIGAEENEDDDEEEKKGEGGGVSNGSDDYSDDNDDDYHHNSSSSSSSNSDSSSRSIKSSSSSSTTRRSKRISKSDNTTVDKGAVVDHKKKKTNRGGIDDYYSSDRLKRGKRPIKLRRSIVPDVEEQKITNFNNKRAELREKMLYNSPMVSQILGTDKSIKTDVLTTDRVSMMLSKLELIFGELIKEEVAKTRYFYTLCRQDDHIKQIKPPKFKVDHAVGARTSIGVALTSSLTTLKTNTVSSLSRYISETTRLYVDPVTYVRKKKEKESLAEEVLSKKGYES